MSPDPYFTSFSFREHNSATVRNILMIHGRIIERSTRSVAYKNNNSAYLGCIIMSPDQYFNLNLSIYNHNCYLLDMLK